MDLTPNTLITLGLGITALAIMLYCLWLVVTLKRQVPGGIIGRRWNLLTILVAFFCVGYLVAPLARGITLELFQTILAAILFFGAIYVLVTIRLIYSVITELSD